MSRRVPRVWVLNLEAEHELESAGRFTPSRHLRAIVERESRRLTGGLVHPDDLVLDERALRERPDCREFVGMCWSPTANARERLRSVGALLPAAPSVEALAAVNSRPFAADVRAGLFHESFEKHVASSAAAALSVLAQPAEAGWLVRRTFGAAGRGRRKVHAGDVREEDRAWLEASLALGPLVIEPWVEVTREYTRSGWVHEDGSLDVARPCLQSTTRVGAWIETAEARSAELLERDDERLHEAAVAAGRALAARGYFGPFGIDAFRHRVPHRVPGSRADVLNPLSEINARFTMDWSLTMELRTPPSLTPTGAVVRARPTSSTTRREA